MLEEVVSMEEHICDPYQGMFEDWANTFVLYSKKFSEAQEKD